MTAVLSLCSLVVPRATPFTQSVTPLLDATDRHRVLPLPRYDSHHSLTITRSLSLSHSVELPASRWSLLYPCSPFIAGHSSACGSIIRTIICRFSNNSLISSLSRRNLSGKPFQPFCSPKTLSFLRMPLSATITSCQYFHSYSHTSTRTTPLAQCASATNRSNPQEMNARRVKTGDRNEGGQAKEGNGTKRSVKQRIQCSKRDLFVWIWA